MLNGHLKGRSSLCPSLPSAIRSVSRVIKAGKGKRREGKKTSGQAFDEFSKINTVCWGDLMVELKCQRLLSCCPCGTEKPKLKPNPKTDGQSVL